MGLRILLGTLQEKMKGFGEGSMMMMNSTQAKFKAAGVDEMMNNLQAKLKQQFSMPENFGLSLVGWFGKIFPPESRKEILHWLRVGAPFVAAGLVLVVLLWFFSRCIGFFFRCIGYCIGFFFRCIGYPCLCICRWCGIRMMKAPGLGFWIPRFLFEAIPKVYFRALRAIAGFWKS